MELYIADVPAALDALRRGRAQLTTRLVQLSNCRVCGAELQDVERAVEVLRELENQLRGEQQ